MILKQRLVIGAAVAAAAATVLTGIPAHAAGVPITERIGGADRYATAIAVTRAAFPETAEVVYIASGSQFPDALSAGAVAVQKHGALLLTQPNTVRADVLAEIRRLAPESIVIAGGTNAVSAQVEHTLRPLAATLTRVGGADRYETSRKLVASAFTGPIDRVYVATGRNFPDALSAVPAAAHDHGPVLLVDGRAASLGAANTALVKQLAPRQIIIVGGTQAVSQKVADDASDLTWTERKAGSDRYETSAVIGALRHSSPHVYVATGENFPDALTGGVLASMKDEPLFLTQPGCPAASLNAVQTWMATTDLTLFGGPAITIVDPARTSSCTRVASMEPRWDDTYLP